ncbi:hypothetical protein [Butyricicoccus pullicaecorum]|uniref:hypothetical protein n=1 Tax=Butyricicoccus pullicaecorum TaxID=501571 RepID=UPI0039905AC7
MKKHKRLFAALLVLAVAIVMLSSAVYIAVQADHDCTGTDCQICYHIASCQQTLRQAALTGSAAAAAAAAAVIYVLYGGLLCAARLFASCTLVSLKVKLSN